MSFEPTTLNLNTNHFSSAQNMLGFETPVTNFSQTPLFNFGDFNGFNSFWFNQFDMTNFFSGFNNFTWQMPTFDNFTFTLPSFKSTSLSNKSSSGSTFKPFSQNISGNINHSYLGLSKASAYQKAKSDSNLEELKGGSRWQISSASFRTDIPFAKKGTGAILDKVAAAIGEELIITSALGTGEAGNPHQKGGYASHHNAENPKLDISTRGKNASVLAQKLKDTGYFSRVSIESDHLDVQIDPSKFKTLNTLA